MSGLSKKVRDRVAANRSKSTQSLSNFRAQNAATQAAKRSDFGNALGFKTVSSNASDSAKRAAANENQRRINATLSNPQSSSRSLNTSAINNRGRAILPLSGPTVNLNKGDLRRANQQLDRGIAPNISSSTPSIFVQGEDGESIRKTLEDEDLTFEQIEALQILSGQEASTQSLTSQISGRRAAAKLLGATDAQAQQFAVSGASTFNGFDVGSPSPEFFNDKGEFGFNKRLQNNINTELQQKQVRRNAARLDAAELAIKNQTTDGKAGDLDNLRGILENAPNQDKPVQRIIASTDETGNLVSPRNLALQTENAVLTGTDENLTLDNITSGGFRATQAETNTANLDQINSVIQNSIEKVTGESFRPDAVSSQLGPDGEIFIDFAPDVPTEIQGLAADQIADDLSAFFGGAGSRDAIRDQILDGQILDLGTIIPNFPEISGQGGGGGGFPILDDVAGGLGLPIFIVIAIIAIFAVVLISRRRKIASI